ncbi:ABC transporter permease [Curtobacterium sp. RRHDQ10]|uniref:ABC transporter permease n=1 Tax=Curtobacterium phyllosphaerae TaxID=3413379 RepID=UPI003BF30921
MVARLLQLRLDLLAGEVRQSVRRSVLVVLGVLLALVVAVVAAVHLGALRTASPDLAAGVVVPVGTLLTLGFTIVPLAVGADDPLDPRRFATFGIAPRPLAVGLGVVGLVGVPVVVVMVLAVSQSVAWMRPGVGFAGVVSVVLIVLTCALFSRVATTAGAWLLAAHRVRDAAWLVAFVVVVLLVPAFVLLLHVDWLAPAGPAVQHVADVAGWTPWGAAWAFPADIATGHTGRGILRLLVALVVVAALAWAWVAMVGRLLRSVGGAAHTRRSRTLGWFDRLGSTPVGAVAARSLTYWGRDPRYRMSYVVLLVVPVIVLPLGVAGVPWHWTALFPLPLMALVAGFLPHNDVAYDNTAVWLHVASGAPGWSDRLGRVTPVLVVGVPLVAAGSVVSAWLFGDWDVLPTVIGVSGGVMLVGLGLSSVSSAALPYPTVRPGDHPFQQPQATGVLATTAQSAMIVLILVCMTPTVWFAVRAFRTGQDQWGATTLLVGLGTGIVVLALGVLIGGRMFDRHGPDILAAAQRN